MIIQTPVIGDSRFKQWSKHLTHVDSAKKDGYAFEGEFISGKVELEPGQYILSYGESGSSKHHYPLATLYRLDDSLTEIYTKNHLDIHWALDIRDDIAKIVNKPAGPLDSLKITISSLSVELKTELLNWIIDQVHGG